MLLDYCSSLSKALVTNIPIGSSPMSLCPSFITLYAQDLTGCGFVVSPEHCHRQAVQRQTLPPKHQKTIQNHDQLLMISESRNT